MFQHVPELIRLQRIVSPSFVVVPQNSAQRKHITLDTHGLVLVLNTIRDRKPKNADLTLQQLLFRQKQKD